MSHTHRLSRGGRIDRKRIVGFTFNGKRYDGHAGDTLASALLANGITLVARSWKYHRPRGIVSCGVEEPNAIVQLETAGHTIPNARATEVELYEGLSACSVNCWPNVERDFMSVTSLFARLMPAGFYYKTFMWPKSLWPKYEQMMRKASGFGTAPNVSDPSTYDKLNAHCDVLIVGAGPAGIAAALAAGKTGARIIVADEQAEFGGRLLSIGEGGCEINGMSPARWMEQAIGELQSMSHVRLLSRSTVFGYHDYNFLTIDQRLDAHVPVADRTGHRERIWRVRAKQVVLAAGAIERPLVFGNNDRPGVMLASAVSSFVNRYGVRPGSRAAVFTNNDSAYQTALDLAAAGIHVEAVIDARCDAVGALPEMARTMGIEVICNSVVVEVEGAKRVGAIKVMALDANGDSVSGPVRVIDCDLLAVSGGWSPSVHLHAQSGGRPRFDPPRACFVPGPPVQAEYSAGACNGSFSLEACLREGHASGIQAARKAGFADSSASKPEVSESVADEPLKPLWHIPTPQCIGRAPKAFVDMQNDVSAFDIVVAAREGYHSIEHVKRYTALGFGTDQGKLGNINGVGILAKVLGNDISNTGTSTFRPNYTPVTFGAIAGRDLGELFEPIRTTALHQWHEENGALFENVGQWKRPWYFPKPGESMQQAVNRECLAARNGVAIMDASTLGKIDIQGPDAVALLNWVYTNAWSKLAVGRCRYGLMLDENGMVMDDGVTTRLAENRFLMTTTTGGAARVLAWLERWLQTEWPHLKVYLTSVTDHYATAAVVGPQSREVVKAVCPDIDFSPDAFPFMSCRQGTVAGVAGRIMRISFSGELAYEVNVPANQARHVWERLFAAGQPFGVTPYGTEAMHVLRAEKGYIIVGQDTDGSVTPLDLGMNWIVKKDKDFIGRRSLFRSDTMREDRKQLVGLLTEQPEEVLPEGCQIVAAAAAPLPVPMLGHVTSSYFSASLGRSIALAVVKHGLERIGETVEVPLATGRVVKAVIAKPVFIDPAGARQNV